MTKKPHHFVKKTTKSYLKNPKGSWETTSRFLRRREKLPAGHVGFCVFCESLRKIKEICVKVNKINKSNRLN